MPPPHQLRYRHTAGWLSAVTFSLMFLPGIAVMVVAPWVGAHAAGPAKGLAPYALFALGLLMTVLGGAVTFGRIERILDREARCVVGRWSVLGFGRRVAFPLGQFDAVDVSARTTSSKGGARYTRHHVALVGPDSRVYLTEFSDLDAARREAARVADFLGLPITQTDA